MKITDKFDHRPWPLPEGPWLMEQKWNRVLFIHWPTHPGRIEPLLPDGLELETYDGSAWLSIVALDVANAHLRSVPAIPFASSFLQLNLRTCVRVEQKPGIYLFSADVSQPLVAAAARQLFFQPCYTATMSHRMDGELNLFSSTRNDSSGPPAEFAVSYGPISPVFQAEPETLDHWLV
ncbi:MAG: DUF2071 domain-containing protein, partial [Armatimonadetes bacterium]|nr:DUF2071 domain-containing protein [Armatimonadota bacterium]